MKASKQLELSVTAQRDYSHGALGRRPEAWFSDCLVHTECAEKCKFRNYRYLLKWPTGLETDRVVLFALANPSTASAEETDPTVARCIGYARRWGFGWCHVVNARAWRATDPKAVPRDDFVAIGPLNDQAIWNSVRAAELVVCGWGELGGTRGAHVLELIRSAGKVPHALKLTKSGAPGHPLYLRADLQPFPML